MRDDLVERLRLNCMCMADTCTMCEAADEIERLQKDIQQRSLDHLTTIGELQTAADEIERLRALCNDLHHDATCAESFCRLCGEGIREWEARRG